MEEKQIIEKFDLNKDNCENKDMLCMCMERKDDKNVKFIEINKMTSCNCKILIKKTNWSNGSYWWKCMDCGKKHDYEYFKKLTKED